MQVPAEADPDDRYFRGSVSPTHAWEMDSISLQKPGAPLALLIQDQAHKFIQTALASPSHRGGKVQCTCQAYPFYTTPRQLYLTGCLQNPAAPIRNPPPVVVVRALSIELMILGKLGEGGKTNRRSKKTSGLPPEARSCILFIYIMSRCWATRLWPKWQGGGVSCCSEPG